MNAIELHRVTKAFNGTVAVDDLSLAVPALLMMMRLGHPEGISLLAAMDRSGRRRPPAPAPRALQNHLT